MRHCVCYEDRPAQQKHRQWHRHRLWQLPLCHLSGPRVPRLNVISGCVCEGASRWDWYWNWPTQSGALPSLEGITQSNQDPNRTKGGGRRNLSFFLPDYLSCNASSHLLWPASPGPQSFRLRLNCTPSPRFSCQFCFSGEHRLTHTQDGHPSAEVKQLNFTIQPPIFHDLLAGVILSPFSSQYTITISKQHKGRRDNRMDGLPPDLKLVPVDWNALAGSYALNDL